MEPDRIGHRLTTSRRRQAGVTVLGFLLLACLFGLLGLAGIKVVPMYIKSMRLSTVLKDVERELAGNQTTPVAIRMEIAKRMSVESLSLSLDDIKITQGRNGYTVRIQYEERAPYLADIWLLMAFDKQIEIRR